MPPKRPHARRFTCVYAHHVPGRLRLKLLRSVDVSAALSAACRELMTIPAALAASPNHVTGSIVFRYDSAMLSLTAACAAVEQLGFAPEPVPAPPSDIPRASVTERLADAAVGRLFEYAVEALAMAAIEAAI